MLDTLFLQIFDMSKVACIVILAVLLVRLCLKRAPKVFSYALWAVVLFRLLCPVSIEAPVSLIPETVRTEPQQINEILPPLEFETVTDRAANNITVQQAQPDETIALIGHSAEPSVWLSIVWLCGIVVMLAYSGISYGRLRRKLLASVKVRDNICIADNIGSPFVMGIIRPKIYLPSSLSEKEQDYIILHEQHHVRRGDHILRLLAFAALCLHWFNPLVWIAFILSGKDMEMSCDEAVLRKLGEDIRADYTASLISLATGRQIIAGTPLAFGEGETMGRVKNIARWKKPAVWVIVIAVIVCVVLAVCLITNPMNRETMLLGAEYRIAEELYRADGRVTYEWKYEKSYLCIGADFSLWSRAEATEWECIGIMEPYVLDNEKLDEMATVKDAWIGHRPGEITDAYILRIGDGLYTFVCCTKRGEVLHGVGTEENGLWFLHHLESVFGKDTTTGNFLDRSLAHTVGGDIDSFFTWSHADIPGYIIIGFESDDSPYKVTLQL